MNKYPFIKQNGLNDCGPACLEMIIEYYKGYIGIDRLSEMTNTNKNGTSAYNIKNISNAIGFSCYATKEIETYPAIALVKLNTNYNHYIVVYRKIKNGYIIADPASKIKKISNQYFNNINLNVILNYKKTKDIIKLNENKISNYYKNMLRNNKSLFFLIFLFSILFLVLSTLYIFIYKKIISDKIINNFFIIFLSVFILKYLVLLYKNKLIIKLDKIIDLDLTKSVFIKLIKLPYLYYKNHTTGEIISRFNDIYNIKNIVIQLLTFLSIELPIFIVILIFMSYINIKISIIVLVIIILYIINNYIFKDKINTILFDTYEAKDNMISYLTATLLSFDYVKGSSMENKFIEYNSYRGKRYINKLFDYNSIVSHKELIDRFILGIGEVFIIYFGITKMLIADFIIYFYLYSYLVDILSSFIDLNLRIRIARRSYKRIYELDIKDNYGKVDKVDNYDIKFVNLNFNYGLKKILNNINLNIKHSSKVFIYGDTGSGKSTLLKIIKGYYKVEEAYIGNEKINNYSPKALSGIIYIGQNDILFNDTLYNNLMCDSNDKIKKYVSLFLLSKLIDNNEQGILMMIDENGFNLSQGQRQHIILVRSILKDFEVLLIDEGLSNLDVSLERTIINNLLCEFKNKTIIFVSHRLNNADLFDKVLYMDNGNIKETRKEGLC